MACADLGVEISAQGFDQRLNSYTLEFLKEMLSRAMVQFKNNSPLPLPILQQFSAINLVDSTVIALPDNMAAEFPGCGGDGPQASVKIQLKFEFLHGNLSQIVLQAGKEPDQNYEAYLTEIQAGSLNINDLGYFVLANLETIDQEQEAYYISRYLFGTSILTSAEKSINLGAILKKATRQPFEQEILLGAKKKLPCRLICIPLPQEVADRRRQKAKEKARSQGKTPSKEYLALLDWLIFVTNVPQEMLSIEQVALLYRIRWQIELVFKLWKSYCRLDHIQGLRRERVLFELYTKMIGIILTQFLVAPLRLPHGAWANRELSFFKVRAIFQRFALELMRSLPRLDGLAAVLTKIFERIERFGLKQKRIKQPNVCHALALASVVYVLEFDIDQNIELPTLLA
ncbi:MAG: IS4 family transposase [bacterium]|nr:IS4 family transposase [bacterium]